MPLRERIEILHARNAAHGTAEKHERTVGISTQGAFRISGLIERGRKG